MPGGNSVIFTQYFKQCCVLVATLGFAVLADAADGQQQLPGDWSGRPVANFLTEPSKLTGVDISMSDLTRSPVDVTYSATADLGRPAQTVRECARSLDISQLHTSAKS